MQTDRHCARFHLVFSGFKRKHLFVCVCVWHLLLLFQWSTCSVNIWLRCALPMGTDTCHCLTANVRSAVNLLDTIQKWFPRTGADFYCAICIALEIIHEHSFAAPTPHTDGSVSNKYKYIYIFFNKYAYKKKFTFKNANIFQFKYSNMFQIFQNTLFSLSWAV